MKRWSLPIAAAARRLAVGTLAAHDLFIKLDRYHLPPNTPVTVPIINGTFLESENSITADRVGDVSLVAGGRRTEVSMEGWDSERDSTYLSLRTGDPGTYVLGVSTLPRSLGMSGADFNEYLAVDGIPDELARREREGILDQEAWEEYSKHIKAVFQVGEVRSHGWDTALGYPAELIPLVNPYEIGVGDQMAVRTVVEGAAVEGQMVLVGGDGTMEPLQGRTDAEGVFRWEVDAPGRWYAKFIHMQDSEKEDLTHESRWASLSFEIR